jgi:TonB family protein
MSKAFRFFGVVLAVALLCGAAGGQAGKPSGIVKLRVFQGAREGALAPVQAVTASYLSHTISASFQAEADQALQAAKIRGVFNLKDVSVLTEADLLWEPGKADKAFHFFQIDKRYYLVMMTPAAPAQRRFRIEVFEQNGGAKVSLLDTEFSLPEKSFAVFGFDDKAGKPYFLSLQTLSWPLAETGSERIPEGDAVRAIGSIRPPRLIKEVAPVYPPAATQARVEGVVILEAQTDIYGRVMNVKILRSIPLLDQAAVDAVRQWVYEPAIIDGKPRSIIFTVTVRFGLKGSKPETAVSGGVVGGVIRAD